MVHGGAQINTLMCAVEHTQVAHEVTLVFGSEIGPEGSLLETALTNQSGTEDDLRDPFQRKIGPPEHFCYRTQWSRI